MYNYKRTNLVTGDWEPVTPHTIEVEFGDNAEHVFDFMHDGMEIMKDGVKFRADLTRQKDVLKKIDAAFVRRDFDAFVVALENLRDIARAQGMPSCAYVSTDHRVCLMILAVENGSEDALRCTDTILENLHRDHYAHEFKQNLTDIIKNLG